MSSLTGDPADEEAIVIDIQLAETNRNTFACVSQCLGSIRNLAATCGGLATPLGRLWANYYAHGAFGEEAATRPHSRYAFGFVITCLLGFLEIKSQGDSKFPFQTHPQTIMVSVTSLLMYGFASTAELVISYARIDPTSVYAMIAGFGRIASWCILVASLASLFYI